MEGETVIAGVDTHKDVHVLCLLDGLGRKIWSGSFGADPEGYDRLAEAIGDPGSCAVVGVEGTASYGAGLTRRLVELGYNVVEVLRPKRDKARPGEGKSDPLDAERAARKAASGRGCSVPKSQDGWVEAVRQLYVARRLAVATSTSCVACAKSMLTTAPGALRERFRGRERPKDLMPLLARGRKAGDALEESVLASLRSVAAVWKEARSQVESLDARIRALLEANAPALLGVLASIYFSPFSPTYFRQSRQRGCAGFANADAPLSASRPPPPSRPHRRWTRPSGGTTVPLS